ncbi:hypothetical protein C6448_004532, partial [Salmonella enterica subsp. diarizonae serovar 16:z10:e,n,x,z15]|nr:hypothetical protein [Salmonella enterica subsp. diarizonae serovar 16:z10:e,n,x,z15]
MHHQKNIQLPKENSYMVKKEGRWGNVTMKRVDNYKYYKGHSEWVSCKRMAQHAMVLEKRIAQLTESQNNSLRTINIAWSKFSEKDISGLNQLKT